MPGPGTYDVNTKPVEVSITRSYGFGGRGGSFDDSAADSRRKKLPPGPGNYPIKSMLATTIGFAFGSGSRSYEKQRLEPKPGPGAYATIGEKDWRKVPHYRQISALSL